MKRKDRIGNTDIHKIKRIIGMMWRQQFTKCPAKSHKKVRAFEAAGDFSHSASHHKCDKCGCDRTAGWGTKGDFYGLGEHTGHYGVGFCRYHEQGHRGVTSLQFARNHLKALQQYSDGEKSGLEFAKIAEVEARESATAIEIRSGLELVKQHLSDFKELCDGGNLQEYQGGAKGEGKQLMPASDVTRIKLALDIAKTMSGLLKDKVYIDSTSYLHIDDVKVRIWRTIQLMEKFIVTANMRKDFIEQYKDIWSDLKTVNRKE